MSELIKMRRKRRRGVQGELPFRSWGGRRRGAGRKPKGPRSVARHLKLAALAARYPVHATVRLVEGLPSLRDPDVYGVVREAFAAGCERFGFRLVQYSVQSNHLHLIAEAKDRQAFSRGMKGLLVRIARAVNRWWGRKGKVFAERYFDRILKTPREVRNALAYVLHNARRHGVRLRQVLDWCASGPWFDGWRQRVRVRGGAGIVRPVAEARTWLVRTGWRRHGLIGVEEVPGPEK